MRHRRARGWQTRSHEDSFAYWYSLSISSLRNSGNELDSCHSKRHQSRKAASVHIRSMAERVWGVPDRLHKLIARLESIFHSIERIVCKSKTDAEMQRKCSRFSQSPWSTRMPTERVRSTFTYILSKSYPRGGNKKVKTRLSSMTACITMI